MVAARAAGNVTAMINTHNKRQNELRDQLMTLHTFAAFRRVPAYLQRKMFAYVDAYWNMTAGLDNQSILNSLPVRLRGTVLLAIHGSLLHECPMLRCCSEECAKTLLLKAKPQVTLQKEDLMVPGQLCTELYILITGSLQVTLASADEDDQLAKNVLAGGPSNRATMRESTARHTGNRATMHSKGSAAASSSHLKGDKLRFRVVEKPGHFIGLSEPFQQPIMYPFRVSALKTSQMLYLQLHDLADILSVFAGADADAVCQVLRSDFMMCWETLKPRGDHRPKGHEESFTKFSDAAKQARELSELREKLSAFEGRLDACIDSLGTVQEQTAVLPQMHAALRAIVDAHTLAHTPAA